MCDLDFFPKTWSQLYLSLQYSAKVILRTAVRTCTEFFLGFPLVDLEIMNIYDLSYIDLIYKISEMNGQDSSGLVESGN